MRKRNPLPFLLVFETLSTSNKTEMGPEQRVPDFASNIHRSWALL
jgi:hypothetical protein